jgi:hypothetical protein
MAEGRQELHRHTPLGLNPGPVKLQGPRRGCSSEPSPQGRTEIFSICYPCDT